MYAGDEFSKDHFPESVQCHEYDVELIDPTINSLNSRHFPCSGIRLQQLKTDIDSLVQQGVLTPGDSPFTSPCFYVLKKAGDAGQKVGYASTTGDSIVSLKVKIIRC